MVFFKLSYIMVYSQKLTTDKALLNISIISGLYIINPTNIMLSKNT